MQRSDEDLVSDVAAALARRGAGGKAPAQVEVRETHISWVFLVGDRAYKLKKPVVLPFVDYGSVAKRRRLCAEEVRLNRRLAPDVYLGVRALVETPDGLDLANDGDPAAIDHVVEMRRYDEGHTMAAKLGNGGLSLDEVQEIGRLLAGFHAGARRVTVAGPAARTVEGAVVANVEELLSLAVDADQRRSILSVERFMHAYVTAHADVLSDRADRGFVREGHGDLRADHVVLNGEPRVVDCLEFDRHMRELDVCDDLAFLVMDLTARGGASTADDLVHAYREAGGDPGDRTLGSFYAAHRALVRAKVALLRCGQRDADREACESARRQARDLVAVAQRFTWQARGPLVMVICGVPASGKSFLARALASEGGGAHLSSDVTRKELAGIAPERAATPEHYSTAYNRSTYTRLGTWAATAARGAAPPVVDATFRHRADRDAFREAFDDVAPLVFVQCVVPEAELERRATERDRDGRGASDADRSIVMRERVAWDPLDDVEAGQHLVVRTDRDVAQMVDDLTALLDVRLTATARRGPATASEAP